MKVLVIGSDAKTHALVWKLTQSGRVEKVYCAPGNPGIAKFADCINIRVEDIVELCEFTLEHEINLTIVNNERAIVQGITEIFEANGQQIFAPSKDAARICSSKGYGKKFMHKYRIPTPKFAVFDKENQALDYARKAQYPLVIKYDSHVHKESAFICQTYNKAKQVIEKCFADLSKTIVIENFIEGKEITISVITDGYNAIPLPSCVQYKKALDSEGGATTDGVGAYAPATFVDFELEEKIAKQIIFPTIDGLNNDKKPYSGILSADIIVDKKENLFTLEFNSTLGNPEAQTILPLIEDDLIEVIYSTVIGALGDEYESLNINDDHSITATLISGNYPATFGKGDVIEGIENIDEDDLFLFYGDVVKNNYLELVTNGGRPLSITAIASTLGRASEKLYESIDQIQFKNMRYRKDIAKSLIIDQQLKF